MRQATQIRPRRTAFCVGGFFLLSFFLFDAKHQAEYTSEEFRALYYYDLHSIHLLSSVCYILRESGKMCAKSKQKNSIGYGISLFTTHSLSRRLGETSSGTRMFDGRRALRPSRAQRARDAEAAARQARLGGTKRKVGTKPGTVLRAYKKAHLAKQSASFYIRLGLIDSYFFSQGLIALSSS